MLGQERRLAETSRRWVGSKNGAPHAGYFEKLNASNDLVVVVVAVEGRRGVLGRVDNL